MKNSILLTALYLLFAGTAGAQVKISSGESAPAPSAMLEVESQSKGFLPPRMTTQERDAIDSPVAGLVIFNSESNCMEYYRGGGVWYSMCPRVPQVSTQVVTLIGATFATSGGSVLNDGGDNITARGICWATSESPTIGDNFTSENPGLGSFSSQMNDLDAGVTYYVRAYATNSAGTGYGEQFSFTTLQLATVVTHAASNVFGKNLTASGDIVSDGGSSVIARGFCWGQSPSPDLSGNYTESGTGTGAFSDILAGLTYSTAYYIRAYATTAAGTAYGNEVQATTNSGTLVSFVNTGTSSWSVPSGVKSLELLVVAGGGGGGANHGGGGGAGGVVYLSDYSIPSASTISVTVGNGGSKSTGHLSVTGFNGENSALGSIVAIGGGGGGNRRETSTPGLEFGQNGGSGGGGGGQGSNDTPTILGGAGTAGQGNAGGTGSYHAGAGGGGAGGVGGTPVGSIGASPSTTYPANGGPGLPFSITGSEVWYGGGGGGGGWLNGPFAGLGGQGGGGDGQINGTQNVNGQANTGGGGGGSNGNGFAFGGNGGSGVVHLRY